MADLREQIDMTHRTCAVDGCERDHTAKGYCQAHWREWRTKGVAGKSFPVLTVHTCTFSGCEKPRLSRDLCQGHTQQRKLGKALAPLRSYHHTGLRDEQGRKRCSSCKRWKTIANFYPKARHADGLTGYCKRCDRDMRLRRNYGIGVEQYGAMLAAQGGGCAICAVTPPEDSSLAVDHDHACCPDRKKSCGSCLRGLLCEDCNRVLGMFRDDPARFQSAIGYLTGSCP
ncbi:endonuclease VII domain-containing protein [Streptomyces sp. NPDC127072]|uniref:endonuclease VII domain-containing protein n=1 Tax=Streptomyces sp. NPDC127072 TaxID=3347129 RepID=UPI0036576AFA